jgi:hypothetical protein
MSSSVVFVRYRWIVIWMQLRRGIIWRGRSSISKATLRHTKFHKKSRDCYHLTACSIKRKDFFGSYSGDGDKFELKLNDNPIISVPYDSLSALPIAEVLVGPEPEPTVNLTIFEPGNRNLTGGQKLLLEWHYQFCHLNFQLLQNILIRAPFVAKRFAAAMKCDLPRCEICKLAKPKRMPKRSETKTKNPERDGALKVNHLSPGTRVSVDHFECRQRGRICDSYVKATSQQYKGGCLFVYHKSSYLHVEHQF